MKKIITPTKEELKHLYIDLKYTLGDLAFYYKCSKKPIKKWLKDYNITKSEEERLQAAKDAYMKKHGVATPFENKEVQLKVQSILKEEIYDNPTRMKQVQDHREQTMHTRYGVKNVGLLKSTQEKSKQKSLQKWGVDHYSKTEEYKQRARATNIKKRGVPYVMQSDEAKQKSKITCMNSLGVDNYAKSQESKDRYKDAKYVKKITEKQYLTKKQNNSFIFSKPEDLCYDLLLTKYSKEDVKRQYNTPLYPFDCDFYIKPLDLYIECNFFWTHGGEPFDKNNPKHITQLNLWKEKNTKFFNNAIDTWTIRDTSKLSTFKNNKLNYKIFYKMEEFKKWFSSLE